MALTRWLRRLLDRLDPAPTTEQEQAEAERLWESVIEQTRRP